jgi:hypothetical protein
MFGDYAHVLCSSYSAYQSDLLPLPLHVREAIAHAELRTAVLLYGVYQEPREGVPSAEL